MSAAAQTSSAGDDYGFRFDDDWLVGDTLASPPPELVVRKHPPRVQLIRARVSFVGETVKSLESL